MGDLTNANRQLNHIEYGNYMLRTLWGRPYAEAGTGLDNISRCFRVELVGRFAPVINTPAGQPPPLYKNSTSNFGVFGSFHFQL